MIFTLVLRGVSIYLSRLLLEDSNLRHHIMQSRFHDFIIRCASAISHRRYHFLQVRYADFVAAAREVFAYKLRENDKKVLKSDSMDDISRSRAELNKSLNTLTGNILLRFKF